MALVIQASRKIVSPIFTYPVWPVVIMHPNNEKHVLVKKTRFVPRFVPRIDLLMAK